MICEQRFRHCCSRKPTCWKTGRLLRHTMLASRVNCDARLIVARSWKLTCGSSTLLQWRGKKGDERGDLLPPLSPSCPPMVHCQHVEVVSLLGAQAVSINEANEPETAPDNTIAVMGAKEEQGKIGTTQSFFL